MPTGPFRAKRHARQHAIGMLLMASIIRQACPVREYARARGDAHSEHLSIKCWLGALPTAAARVRCDNSKQIELVAGSTDASYRRIVPTLPRLSGNCIACLAPNPSVQDAPRRPCMPLKVPFQAVSQPCTSRVQASTCYHPLTSSGPLKGFLTNLQRGLKASAVDDDVGAVRGQRGAHPGGDLLRRRVLSGFSATSAPSFMARSRLSRLMSAMATASAPNAFTAISVTRPI